VAYNQKEIPTTGVPYLQDFRLIRRLFLAAISTTTKRDQQSSVLLGYPELVTGVLYVEEVQDSRGRRFFNCETGPNHSAAVVSGFVAENQKKMIWVFLIFAETGPIARLLVPHSLQQDM
jgi:hypothetical protein